MGTSGAVPGSTRRDGHAAALRTATNAVLARTVRPVGTKAGVQSHGRAQGKMRIVHGAITVQAMAGSTVVPRARTNRKRVRQARTRAKAVPRDSPNPPWVAAYATLVPPVSMQGPARNRARVPPVPRARLVGSRPRPRPKPNARAVLSADGSPPADKQRVRRVPVDGPPQEPRAIVHVRRVPRARLRRRKDRHSASSVQRDSARVPTLPK